MTGTVQRYESGNLIATFEKVECVMSKRDLIPGDSYRPGDTIRAAVIDIKKVGQKVQIVISRSCDEFVLRLFELEVPEIHEGLVEVKAIARIPGYRTKVAIKSNDSRIDSVGACVGVRGARIRNVVGELNGEKIDIIEWNETPEMLIVNALKPAEVLSLEIDDASHSARAIVDDEQLSLAIGKRGQNVKLATQLTGWNLEIVTQEQDIAEHDAFQQDLVEFGGTDKSVANKIIRAGYEIGRRRHRARAAGPGRRRRDRRSRRGRDNRNTKEQHRPVRQARRTDPGRSLGRGFRVRRVRTGRDTTPTRR